MSALQIFFMFVGFGAAFASGWAWNSFVRGRRDTLKFCPEYLQDALKENIQWTHGMISRGAGDGELTPDETRRLRALLSDRMTRQDRRP